MDNGEVPIEQQALLKTCVSPQKVQEETCPNCQHRRGLSTFMLELEIVERSRAEVYGRG